MDANVFNSKGGISESHSFEDSNDLQKELEESKVDLTNLKVQFENSCTKNDDLKVKHNDEIT